MKSLLRIFFRLLYHQFAFTYDLVAAAVSFNRWTDWVGSVVPFVEGERVLEMGHGPGHLQRLLHSGPGRAVVGIDESAQMGRIARRNLRRRGRNSESRLTRGRAQTLPFATGSFDTIVATFPTEYITDPRTLAEVKRCLRRDGRLVVLPVAWPRNRLLDWLFRVTHQAPAEALETVSSRLGEPFVQAGFDTEVRTLNIQSGVLLLVLARK